MPRGRAARRVPAKLARTEAALATLEQWATDLRLAAGTSLVLLDDGDHAARWLALELAGESDPAGAERALETWLTRGAEGARAGFSAALAEWNREAGPPGVVPSLEQTRERWARRGPSTDGDGSKLSQCGSVRFSGSSPSRRCSTVVPLRKSPRTKIGVGSSVSSIVGSSRSACSTRRCVPAIRVQSIHAAILPMKLRFASWLSARVNASRAPLVAE